MTDREAIYLDSVDGFEFERICQRILERIHGCNVEDTVPVGDEGKDLIIHGPAGPIIVECKHQPNSSVGRPVVQKLHSAILAAGSRRGILITTGTFSKAAYEYADRLKGMGVIVQLVDRPVLADMAARAGMVIVMDGKHVPVWSYDVSSKDRIEKTLADYLDDFYQSVPARPSHLLKVYRRDIDLVPAYEIGYSINAAFETNVGVVHRETLSAGRFFIDGESGRILTSELTDFFSQLPARSFPVDTMKEWNPNSRPFSMGIGPVKEIASSEIIRRHTKNVRYSGRNNRIYEKTCVPNNRQFTITNLRQIYLPVNSSKIQLLQTPHQIQYLEHPTGQLRVLNASLRVCGVCGREVSVNPILCNLCGTPVHHSTLIGPHSFRCAECGKTLCRSCARYVPKYLLLKKPLCDTCVKRYQKQRVHGFAPVRG